MSTPFSLQQSWVCPSSCLSRHVFEIPKDGFDQRPHGLKHVRAATNDDISQMSQLEYQIAKITRDKDYRYLIDNQDDLWSISVCLPGIK